MSVYKKFTFNKSAILTLTLFSQATVVKYLALIVATATAGSVYPILWPKRVEAARGTTAAAIAIGITNGCAQFQGILGPQLFISVLLSILLLVYLLSAAATLGPTYRISFIVCIALLVGAIVMIVLSAFLMRGDGKGQPHSVTDFESEKSP